MAESLQTEKRTDDACEDHRRLTITYEEIAEGEFKGYFRVVSVLAITPPSVTMIDVEDAAYTMEEMQRIGDHHVKNNSRMQGYRVELTPFQNKK